MKIKGLLSGVLASAMLTTPVFAEMNSESLYLDVVLNYVSNLYINDGVTSDHLMQEAIEEAVRENPELMYSMIKSAFGILDEYSEFYTAEEYEKQFQRLNRIFYGMGVLIQLRDGNINIIQVQEGGGAEAAGILAGDIIIAVDGTSVLGFSTDEVVNMVAGDEGTTVKVKILRDGVEMEFDVERKRVDQSTAGYSILENNIGYLAIYSFADITPSEVKEALGIFDENGITDIILDLRSNPGGILTSVLDVANMLVPEGAIMHAMYRDETRNVTYSSENKESKYSLAVLVNGDTASAAEVLTGALQDSGAGYIIGEKTFGKGLIQEIFNLQNGDAFKLTTGHYLTRDGHDIQGVGIEPDEVVKNHTEQIDVTQYETFDYATKWRLGDAGKGVLAAKQRLSVMGYYSGPIDENFDLMLEHAVYNFQEAVGLYPYGVLDFSTQATMENHFYVLDVLIDDQFEAAYNYFTQNSEA
ncbi:MAG: PDZ domain-containing protein [Clostridia bacterium]|nr:PDZ domain-containing protein [Clostridia bacterium]